jgi:hypothetical protein
MRMISDHRIWLIGLCFPFLVVAAEQPCNLTGANRVGQGWLDAKKKSQVVLTYLVSRKQFESTSMTRAWTMNLQARDAALKGFTDYFRRISPPASENSALSVRGMQAKEMKCIEGVFISYEVNLANLSWEEPAVSTNLPKDELSIPVQITSANADKVSTSQPKQSFLAPVGIPKGVVEE